MSAQYIPVSFSTQFVRQSQNVPSDCNAITFINQGVDTFTVMGATVLQGQSIEFTCNVGEVDNTNYAVKFAGSGGVQECLVITKKY